MKLFTVNEVAQILKIHRHTVMKLIYDGKLKHTKIGEQYRISDKQLDKYLKANSND